TKTFRSPASFAGLLVLLTFTQFNYQYICSKINFMENILLYFVTAFIVAQYLLERWLDQLNLKHWKNEIPSEMKGFIDAEQYAKTQACEKAKKSIGTWGSTLST